MNFLKSNDKIKILKLVFFRFCRHVPKKIFAYLPLGLCILSIIMFSSIVFPSITYHYLPTWNIGYTKVLTLKGQIYSTSDNKNIYHENIPIQIGGYETLSDSNGNYSLTFTSKISTNIPVIIYSSDKSKVLSFINISYLSNETTLTKDLILTAEEES